MAGLLFAVAMLAAPPLPSKVFTVKVSTYDYSTNTAAKGSIVVGVVAPSGSRLFSDEQEVLASINTVNYG